jgi:hypothetical protein
LNRFRAGGDEPADPAVEESMRRVRGFLASLFALGLASCLSSDPPALSPADLATPHGFAGDYFATRFPEDTTGDLNTVDAKVEAAGDRGYLLTFFEGEHKDAPVRIRLLDLAPDLLLAVISDPKPDSDAIYAVVTAASNGAWVFRAVDLRPDVGRREIRWVLQRHGATSVAFDSSDPGRTQIAGTLSAADLRMLFTDPDFLASIETDNGFRLSPKR